MVVLLVSILISYQVALATASIPCDTDEICKTRYKSSLTICLPETKTCSNPFQQGCLKTLIEDSPLADILPEKYPRRVCNSDDLRNETIPAYCEITQFDYPEIRVHNGNWESSMIISWIYQIILSELVRVPATVGLTSADTPLASFYSMRNEFIFSAQAYPYDAIKMANRVADEYESNRRKDCSFVDLPCVDVLPEVWLGQAIEYIPLVRDGVLSPPNGVGLIGRSGIYIPQRTVREFPEFSIWYGLAGEENRQRLAQVFRRPLSWKEYCDVVDSTQCRISSVTALRYPSATEEGAFFADGLYTGFFSGDGTNNCTENPTTCAGHIITPDCSWSSPLDAQLFWNDIAGLTRLGGPLSPVSGYSAAQVIQVYRAANATGNHVILHWYEPEPAYFEFQGTDYEFMAITFPPVTKECLQNRPDTDTRCSADPVIRRGNSSLGSCGDDIQPLQRVFIRLLDHDTESLLEVDRSPAHDFIGRIQISNLDISDIIQKWRMKRVDPTGNDVRAAVCEWVAVHLGELQELIPLGYPRILVYSEGYDSWYALTARVLASVVASVAVLASLAVFKYRNTKSMIFTQPIFLQLILVGFFLTAMGAVYTGMEPSEVHCLASAWLLLIGYTTELVPVLVKTSKINHLIRSYSKTKRRVHLNRPVMLLQVAAVVSIAIGFLIAWTVIDPPRAVETRSIVSSQEDDVTQETVESSIKCTSKDSVWLLIAFSWSSLLLIFAALLAFQSRDVMAQLNESQSLGVMVYSHFLFVVLRGICTVFALQETFAHGVTAALLSLTSSLDVLAAMAIYVFPKIITARNAPAPYKPGMLSSLDLDRRVGTEDDVEDDENESDGGDVQQRDQKQLSVLVCSANLGNKEPTLDSLRTWIPPYGDRSNIKPMMNEKDSSHARQARGPFGLIAIGMQEATWTDALENPYSVSPTEKKEISETEVLNALDEANTVHLREMIHDVLGDGYFLITDERRGQMRLHLWATRTVAQNITGVEITGANTGIGNLLANKGGIVASVYFGRIRISFVTAHLAAHEGDSYYKARCENIGSILHDGKTFDHSAVKFDVSTTSHHTFFLGDLNFRTRFDLDSTHEERFAMASRMIEAGDLSQLYDHDEMQQGLEDGDFLVGFETLRCMFPPTFKVERRPELVYSNQRIPSWTDRILYASSPGLEGRLEQTAYEACIGFDTSDHKPIRGAFSLLSNETFSSVDRDVTFDFKKIRCSRLVGVSASAKSNPYAMLLWDGVSLSSEHVAPLAFLRAFWSGQKSWPRTSSIRKTANPYWKGEVISVGLEDSELGSHAKIYLAVVQPQSYFGRNEVVGATVLNLHDIVATSMNTPPDAEGPIWEHTLDFEKQLLRDGKCSGYIKFQLTVKKPRRDDRHRKQRRRSTLSSLRGQSRRIFAPSSLANEDESSSLFERRRSVGVKK